MDTNPQFDMAGTLADQLCELRKYFSETDEIYRRFRTRLLENAVVIDDLIPVEWLPFCKQ